MEKVQMTTATDVAIGRAGDAPFDVFATWARRIPSRLNAWYNGKSEFFSAVLGENCTWKTAIRVNLITLSGFIGAFCIEQNFMVTGLSCACAGWLTYRLNADDKSASKKGGRK